MDRSKLLFLEDAAGCFNKHVYESVFVFSLLDFPKGFLFCKVLDISRYLDIYITKNKMYQQDVVFDIQTSSCVLIG